MIGTETVEVVFDTFAWIEEFDHGTHGEAVHRTLLARRVGTPLVVLAELAHLYETRAPRSAEVALSAVRATSDLLPLTADIAVAAGVTRARLAKTRRGIGLVDCMVYETARAHGVPLLTGDPHLKGLEGVGFLGDYVA